MCNEIWRPVNGYEWLYEVSNLGRVKSLDYNHTGKERLMTPQLSKKYYQVYLWKGGKPKGFKVHRLVWEAFRGPIPKGMQVNHIDENPANNALSNLNIMSPKENINWGTGIERRAEQRNKTIVQYDMDGNFVKLWNSQKEIVAELHIGNSSHISECCPGKREHAHGFKWGFKKVV